jgi:hypothetical protein
MFVVGRFAEAGKVVVRVAGREDLLAQFGGAYRRHRLHELHKGWRALKYLAFEKAPDHRSEFAQAWHPRTVSPEPQRGGPLRASPAAPATPSLLCLP